MKDKIIIVGVLLALALGGFALTKPSKVVVQSPDGKSKEVVVGSSNPVSVYDYSVENGIETAYRKTSFTTATGTPCSIQSPNATSTLKYTTWGNNTATDTAATIRMATSTTPYATTTSYATFSIPANTQKYWSWFGTTTASGGTLSGIFAPNTYIVFGAEGSSVGGFTYSGSCQAEFTVISR